MKQTADTLLTSPIPTYYCPSAVTDTFPVVLLSIPVWARTGYAAFAGGDLSRAEPIIFRAPSLAGVPNGRGFTDFHRVVPHIRLEILFPRIQRGAELDLATFYGHPSRYESH
jgi:hypothetical protein